ncbi:VPLPA-CTERM sorting domain-containing protein [uncultured Rhodospira sp.]|uniref:VPLPA-CTERM sorting domain-containing protein n=1 Tax=uncultured Rhodospira sp. TaxID=1936189 RepID=UPI00261438BA|nr:VPLPA-CTERM sorting domain-containing protein [uncultured Rhodospira sp.]
MNTLANKTLSVLTATGLALAVAMGAAAPAHAALIDFTAGTPNDSITNPFSGSVLGVGYTVTASDDFGTDGVSQSVCQSHNPSLACGRDGLGVGDDEISASSTAEWIEIVFDTAVLVGEFYVLDLFWANDGQDEPADPYEVGAYTLTFDGGATTSGTFEADDTEVVDTSDVGYLAVALNQKVKAIKWTYIGDTNDEAGVGDYAVAGLTVTPLPAAAWFLLTALGGLVGTRWLRKAPATAA